MGLVDNRSDTVVQGPDSNWASGPSHQGSNRSAVVVPLVVPGTAARGARLEQAALELVPRVLAGSMVSGAVAPAVLLARLVHMSVTVEVWLERGDKGPEGCHSWSRSLAGMCANTLLPPA